MSEHRFALAVAGGVARLRMIRAEGRNAIDPLWVTELEAAVTALEQERSARAVLIVADGPWQIVIAPRRGPA